MIALRLKALAVVAALVLQGGAGAHHKPKLPGPSWDRAGPSTAAGVTVWRCRVM
jgi:hypothetical protein